MVHQTYYGEISDEWKQDWGDAGEDPFQVLRKNNDFKCGDWETFFQLAPEVFTDEVQVDWGSFAYKATKDMLIEMRKRSHGACRVRDESKLQDGVIYGVVFIEMY